MKTIDRLSWVALAAISGIGSQKILYLHNYLIKHDIGWEDFWVLNEVLQEKIGINIKLIDGIKKFKKEHTIYTYHEFLKQRHIQAIVKGEQDYPPLLANNPYSPVVLFSKGCSVTFAEQPVVAVVGTRKITAYGQLVTQKIVTELSHLGALIVSGFMYGVDIEAHRACLAAGGITIGVLGYGFDFCYPANQEKLFNEMLSRGATFLSPFAPDVTPKRGQFVARNRVVAAMSHAVVVTEAAEKSGSHITAGYALEEGRVVCAVPGPITNPYSEGTRSLINQGAILIKSGREVLQECDFYSNFPTQSKNTAQQQHSSTNPLLSILQTGAFSVEEMMELSTLQYTSVISRLTELELSGKVVKQGSKWHLKG